MIIIYSVANDTVLNRTKHKSTLLVGLALKNRSSSDNPVILAIERYWMTSCKSRL